MSFESFADDRARAIDFNAADVDGHSFHRMAGRGRSGQQVAPADGAVFRDDLAGHATAECYWISEPAIFAICTILLGIQQDSRFGRNHTNYKQIIRLLGEDDQVMVYV